MTCINLNELRFKLKESEYTAETKWIEVGGVRCFVHPKSPGGWRRIMKLKEGGGPEWIIYYAHDERLFEYKSVIKSAESYFPLGKVMNIQLEQDMVYVDPTGKLKFDVTSDYKGPVEAAQKVQPFAVSKLQTLEAVMSKSVKVVYQNALSAFTSVLTNPERWTYDTQRLTTNKMYAIAQLDTTGLTEPEMYLVLKAIKSFFEPSADQITYKIDGSKCNFLFIIEV